MADSTTVDTLANGIAGIESAGQPNPYGAMGPTTKSGDRAYGKYQIMGANVPQWTEEAGLGRMTPADFANNPDAQEKTARYKMGQYLDAHNGSVRDAAALWHSGVPYDQAVNEGRADQLGTTTKDYADRVAGSSTTSTPTSPAPSTDTIIALPDGTNVNLGPNPSDADKAAFKAKVYQKWPQLAQQAGASTTTTPTSTTPAPPAPSLSIPDASVDEAGAALNTHYGLPADHRLGRYTAALGKPAADALNNVYNALTQPTPGVSGDPREWSTWLDGAQRALTLLSPLGIPASAANNVIQEGLKDAGAPPWVQSVVGFMGSLYIGAKTPIPGLTGKPTAVGRALGLGEAAPVAEMPLQGTAAARAAATETGAAAGESEATAASARAASEAAATKADTTATTADEATRQAAPSPEAAGRAQEALAPSGTTPTSGGAAATQALGAKLNEIKEPVQGIYDSLIQNAEAEHRSLDPSNYQAISAQIAALKDELGPTLSGPAKDVIDTVEQQINSGQRLGAAQIDKYKQQLDTLLPGRVPRDATPKLRQLYQFKWDVRDMMRSMYDGEEKKWAEAADYLWRDTIIGKDNPTALGNIVALAKKNPATFVERIFGNGSTDKQGVFATAVMKHLGDSDAATSLREATLARAINQAKDETTGNLDPAKLLANVGKYGEDFYKSIVGDAQDNFFKALQKEQGAVGETKFAAKAAGREAGAAERTAKAAESTATATKAAAEKAAETATKPNRLAYIAAKGLEIGASEAFGRVVGHVPGAGTLGLFIPAERLATALADSKTANLLARAMITAPKTPAAITIIEALRDRNKSVNFLGSR